MHRNLPVSKTVEAMCMAYAQKRYAVNSPMSQTRHEANDHGRYACIVKGKWIVCEEHLFLMNHLMNPGVKVLLKCVIRFSISFCWYIFLNFCTNISRPLAYCVCISKASMTVGCDRLTKIRPRQDALHGMFCRVPCGGRTILVASRTQIIVITNKALESLSSEVSLVA